MMESRIVKIGLVQMAPDLEKEKSLNIAIEGIRAATKNGAEVVCLPELFTSKYFCQQEDNQSYLKQAETCEGMIVSTLSRIAKETRTVIIGGSFVEKSEDGYYNTAPVIESDGRLIGTYRKVNLPNDENFYEQTYFKPGQTYKVFNTSRGVFAPLICFDQWYPEAARAVAMRGAEVIFYPTALGDVESIEKFGPTEKWQEMWQRAQVGSAVQNNIYIAAVNRYGGEDKINFFGNSFIADPAGEIIAQSKNMADDIIIADLDLNYVGRMQEGWGFLRSRKEDVSTERI